MLKETRRAGEKGGRKMIGAILGDIVGSPYEFDRGEKKKDFGPYQKSNR